MIPRISKTAGQVSPKRSDFMVRRMTMKVSPAIITKTKVRSRLPNSIRPWIPISGTDTNDSSVHFGQVGQPRPDPVRRTSPPVTTISIWLASEAQA